MKKSIRRIWYSILVAAIAATPSVAASFRLEVSDRAATHCRDALEKGKVLKTEDSVTYILFEYYIYAFTISLEEVSCKGIAIFDN